MNILFLGDVSGKIGRKVVKKMLLKIKREYKVDLTIANVENIAHGSGVTRDTVKEIMLAGVDVMTSGDHAFSRIKQKDIYDEFPIIRPANFSHEAPGRGYIVTEIKSANKKNKKKILVVNLIGRVFMKMNYECPFKAIDKILLECGILANNDLSSKKYSAIIVDIHAECTSEKVALAHYVNGRASAVLGTHTHVMTADHKISSKGTASITDTGMNGFADGVLGLDRDGIIRTYLTQIKYPHVVPDKGKAIFNAVIVEIDSETAKAKSIKPVIRYVDFK